MTVEERERFLKGQVAIVTGSRIGIGRDIARGLAEAGAAIVLNGSRDEGKEELLDEFQSISPAACYVKADITEKEEAKRLVASAVDEFGSVDILVNNAGVTMGSLLFDYSEEDWERIFRINLDGALYCIQEVLPIMRQKKKGNIVNVSSTAGFDLPIFTGAYSISKACLSGLTKILAKEEASYGIRVNAVAPAYIPTEMTKMENPEKDQKLHQKLLSRTPLGRLGRPEDVTRTVLFLVSERSSTITGEVIRISGGHQMPL
jgi:3-oxoacyl-[acyl-carrier protein] reductase